MATIDPNIAMGYKPVQIENPMNQYAAMSQIQNAQNQNALAQYQLSAAKRADEATNIQNQLYAKHYNPQTGEVNKAGLFADLAQTPAAGLIPKLQTQFSELKHKENLDKKVTAETIALEFKNKNAELDKAISQIAAFNTPQDTIDAIDKNLASGKIDQEKADWLKNSLEQAPNFRAWQKSTLLNNLDAKDKLHQEYQDTMAKIAGGNLGVAQGNLAVNQYNATKPVYSEASGGFVTPPTAKNPTSTIIPLSNPEATTKGQVVTKGKGLVSDVATDMATAYGVLKELKGIKSQSNAPSENVSAALQSSTIGQIGGSLLGTKEQDARDVIMSQRPILVQGIVKATGMTASQINSNQELKNLLDAATDPSKGYETNIKTLNKINKRFGLGGDIVDLSTTPVTPDKVTMGKKPTVATQNEVNTVTTSDGKTFVFPTPAAAAQFKQAAGIK